MWAIAAGLIWEVCLVISLNFVPSQITKGYEFESETDTEVIPKLIKYVYDNREGKSVTFSTLVERVIQQLVSRCTIATHQETNQAWNHLMTNVTTEKHVLKHENAFLCSSLNLSWSAGFIPSDWTVTIFI